MWNGNLVFSFKSNISFFHRNYQKWNHLFTKTIKMESMFSQTLSKMEFICCKHYQKWIHVSLKVSKWNPCFHKNYQNGIHVSQTLSKIESIFLKHYQNGIHFYQKLLKWNPFKIQILNKVPKLCIVHTSLLSFVWKTCKKIYNLIQRKTQSVQNCTFFVHFVFLQKSVQIVEMKFNFKFNSLTSDWKV